MGGGDVAVETHGGAESVDRHPGDAEEGEDARLQGVQGDPAGVPPSQFFYRIWPLWNGTGASVQVALPQARSISSGRFCTSSGAEMGVFLATGLEVRDAPARERRRPAYAPG